ncbi:MAG: hypothetical protein NTW05_04570 [Pseudonocardiales bacterium]|nr:hypothetical protein [Pseudonocardiales bacterium]
MNTHDPGFDVIGCPRCGAPAEVVDRFDLTSTDGPVGHVRLQCARRHWLTARTEDLPSGAPAAAQVRSARGTSAPAAEPWPIP